MDGSAGMDGVQVREGVDQPKLSRPCARWVSAYKYGWSSDIEMEYAPKGLNEDIVRLISEKNSEPAWMTDWRLDAYRALAGQMSEADPGPWSTIPPSTIRTSITTPSRPRCMAQKPKSLDEVDPKLLATYEKLGIPLKEQMILAGVEGADEAAPAEGRKVAVDAVFDSVSVGTTFQD